MLPYADDGCFDDDEDDEWVKKIREITNKTWLW